LHIHTVFSLTEVTTRIISISGLNGEYVEWDTDGLPCPFEKIRFSIGPEKIMGYRAMEDGIENAATALLALASKFLQENDEEVRPFPDSRFLSRVKQPTYSKSKFSRPNQPPLYWSFSLEIWEARS
jgi:hypothetical protein